MRKRESNNLYDDVVSITYEFLGPAADRFVTRQIRNHLHKDPEDLQKNDLVMLIDWICLAMAHLSDEDRIIKKYRISLKGLLSANGRSK